MEELRDRFWIWGHSANSLHGLFGIRRESNVSPFDGLRQLGARNLFYIPMLKPVDREGLSGQMQETSGKFAWSIENPEQAEQLFTLKRKYPKLQIGIYDDFLRPENDTNNNTINSPESLRQLRKRMNDAGMELWMVFYERDLDVDITPYLDSFDGITFWFWSQQQPEQYEAALSRFVSLTPGKRRMLGCYLYDFGRERSADAQLVIRELERGRELIRNGTAEGLILHTNAVGGMEEPGYDAAVQWMRENGDEKLYAAK